MIRRLLPLMFSLLVFVAAFTREADAAPPAPGGGDRYAEQVKSDKVELRIMVVHATSSHNRVDSRLQNLTRYLSHLKYTGYELLQTHSEPLAEKGKTTFTIEGGSKVTIELLSKEETKVRLRVVMTRGAEKLLDTTLSINRNGTFIVAGPKYQGGILVLPLTARY